MQPDSTKDWQTWFWALGILNFQLLFDHKKTHSVPSWVSVRKWPRFLSSSPPFVFSDNLA